MTQDHLDEVRARFPDRPTASAAVRIDGNTVTLIAAISSVDEVPPLEMSMIPEHAARLGIALIKGAGMANPLLKEAITTSILTSLGMRVDSPNPRATAADPLAAFRAAFSAGTDLELGSYERDYE